MRIRAKAPVDSAAAPLHTSTRSRTELRFPSKSEPAQMQARIATVRLAREFASLTQFGAMVDHS